MKFVIKKEYSQANQKLVRISFWAKPIMYEK